MDFFILHLLSFLYLTARNRREVPCRVELRLARCDNLTIQGVDTMQKSIIGLILRGVSALLCIMG